MPYRVAVRNLFETKEVIFSHEELAKVIGYAITNDLIEFELRFANGMILKPDGFKNEGEIKLPFYDDGMLKAELSISATCKKDSEDEMIDVIGGKDERK